MKMNLKNIKVKGLITALFTSLVILSMSSCTKDDHKNPLDGAGSPYLRLDALTSIGSVLNQNLTVTAMDASPHTQTVFIIHRDAISNSDLNKTVTVNFAVDSAYLKTYNLAAQHVYDTAYVNDSIRVYNATYSLYMSFNDTISSDSIAVIPITANNYDSLHNADPDDYDAATFTDWEAEIAAYAISVAGPKGSAYAAKTAPTQYQVLPKSVYSWVEDGNPITGNQLTFAPGETTKELAINIDPTNLSFSVSYALPLTLYNSSSGYKISGDNTSSPIAVGYSATHLINQIIVKNQYDGTYSYTGKIVRLPVVAGDALAGTIVSGVTIDLATAGANSVDFDGWVWASGGTGIGGIGSTGPHLVVNADNTITVSPIGASPAAWGPISGSPNYYDPSTKTFYISYQWSNGNRQVYLVLKYLGPRS